MVEEKDDPGGRWRLLGLPGIGCVFLVFFIFPTAVTNAGGCRRNGGEEIKEEEEEEEANPLLETKKRRRQPKEKNN